MITIIIIIIIIIIIPIITMLSLRFLCVFCIFNFFEYFPQILSLIIDWTNMIPSVKTFPNINTWKVRWLNIWNLIIKRWDVR